MTVSAVLRHSLRRLAQLFCVGSLGWLLGCSPGSPLAPAQIAPSPRSATPPKLASSSPATVAPQPSSPLRASLRFEPAPGGAYRFDTGMLAGRLRREGRSTGLVPVIFKATGEEIAAGEGLFNHYRVFTRGKRYGYGARRWPSTATVDADGRVEVLWPATSERPFELRARYAWSAPNTLDLTTTVRAMESLEAFEVFLASYYPSDFNDSRVWARTSKDGTPGFVAATLENGEMQAFPRDDAAARLIGDGRWDLEPHPIRWTTMPHYDKALMFRRNPRTGLTVISITRAEDCFGVFSPHGEEKHYSNYMSTFGRSLAAGETSQVRSRLVVLRSPSDAEMVALADRFLNAP